MHLPLQIGVPGEPDLSQAVRPVGTEGDAAGGQGRPAVGGDAGAQRVSRVFPSLPLQPLVQWYIMQHMSDEAVQVHAPSVE